MTLTLTLCPYCQGPIHESEETITCGGCETPHHKDCYEENKGCTVFGCTNAPPEEPKLSVSAPELAAPLSAPAIADGPRIGATVPPPPPPDRPMTTEELQTIASRVVPSIFSSYEETTSTSTETESSEPKNRMGYMILGALLGPFGAHNWYAGYYKKAGAQLAITVLTLGFGSPMSWIWAIIDICTVDRDSKGVQFAS